MDTKYDMFRKDGITIVDGFMDAVNAIEFNNLEPHINHYIELRRGENRRIELRCMSCFKVLMSWDDPEREESNE